MIINTEPKKSISMSKTLCSVIINSRPKEKSVLRQDTQGIFKESMGVNVHLLLKGP